MNVHGTANQHAQAIGQLKRQHSQEHQGNKLHLKEEIMSKLETKTDAQLSQSKGEAKGVVRLLQEGHFKGVADLRHRINFHEQLQHATNQAATTSLEEG